jgi:hypothetical protein
MVPNEITFTARFRNVFFSLHSTKLPPHAVHRIPITVRLMMILSKSINAITGTKMRWIKKNLK